MWLLRTHLVVRSVVSESPTYRRLEGSPECAVTKWRVPILSGQKFPTWGRAQSKPPYFILRLQMKIVHY